MACPLTLYGIYRPRIINHIIDHVYASNFFIVICVQVQIYSVFINCISLPFITLIRFTRLFTPYVTCNKNMVLTQKHAKCNKAYTKKINGKSWEYSVKSMLLKIKIRNLNGYLHI